METELRLSADEALLPTPHLWGRTERLKSVFLTLLPTINVSFFISESSLIHNVFGGKY